MVKPKHKGPQLILLTAKKLNQKFKLPKDTSRELLIIDLLPTSFDMNMEVELADRCKLHVIVSSFNQANYQKNFMLKVFHNQNDAESKFEVYGVNKDASCTKFFLEAYIDDDSKRNNCEQRIRGILLSNEAEIHGKPNLIINTNNIKAKHALAIGRLNLNHLFYLQSKGLDKNFATKLLLMSYFNIILSKLNDPSKQERLYQKIFTALGEITA